MNRLDRCSVWTALGVLLGGGASLLGPHFDAARTILAAIRLLNGQHVYREFPIPEGPVSAWLLVPFLWLAPSIGWGTVMASGALNGFAVACAWRIAYVARGNVAARAAAVLTSIWFLPVFDTYYLDHLAYAWVLAALASYLSFRSPAIRGSLCGTCLALAYHTKQTVGTPALAALVVAVLVVDGHRALRERTNLWAAAGLLSTHATFFLIIALSASLPSYYAHSVELPIAFARANGRSVWRIPAALLLPFGIDPVEMFRAKGLGRVAFYPVVLAIYASYAWLIRLFRHGQIADRAALIAGLFLTLSTTWCSILLGRLYAHVTFGVWCLVALLTARLPLRLRFTIVALYGLLGIAHVAELHWVRPVWRPAQAEGELRPWLISNPEGAWDVEGALAAVEHLRDDDRRIAILTESAEIIVIALRRPTFEPAFDFTDLNFPADEERRRRWERSFAETLDREQVHFLLWSDHEPSPHHALTARAEGLVRFIDQRYGRVRSFGRYVLLERRAMDSPPTTAEPLHPTISTVHDPDRDHSQ